MGWLQRLLSKLLGRRKSGWNAQEYGNPAKDDGELNRLNGGP